VSLVEERAGPGLDLTDRVVLGYTGVALVTVVASEVPGGPWWAAFHVLVLVGIALLARAPRAGPAGWLHLWYPVLLLPWLYREAGALRHLVIRRDLDPLVARWDAALFPAWYATLPPRLPVAALELLHAGYFSYYLCGRRLESAGSWQLGAGIL
jgi:hypothetical protein